MMVLGGGRFLMSEIPLYRISEFPTTLEFPTELPPHKGPTSLGSDMTPRPLKEYSKELRRGATWHNPCTGLIACVTWRIQSKVTPSLPTRHRGTLLITNRTPPRTAIGPYTSAYGRYGCTSRHLARPLLLPNLRERESSSLTTYWSESTFTSR